MILDFGIGQRGLLHRRPHHRPKTAIQKPVLHELHRLARDHRLGLEIHGGIGPLEIADLAQPLNLFALHLQPMAGKDAAFMAQHILGNVVLGAAFGAEFFLHLPFNGQAVTIPAGHIRRVLAQHALRAHHKVLQDVIEAGARMNIAVGIDRPVMQNEKRPAPRPLPDFPIQVHRRPARQPARLGLGQARLHRKIGGRQEQGATIIAPGFRRFFRGIGHDQTLLTDPVSGVQRVQGRVARVPDSHWMLVKDSACTS